MMITLSFIEFDILDPDSEFSLDYSGLWFTDFTLCFAIYMSLN